MSMLDGKGYFGIYGTPIYNMEVQMLLWEYTKAFVQTGQERPLVFMCGYPRNITPDVLRHHAIKTLAPEVKQEYIVRQRLNSVTWPLAARKLIKGDFRLLEQTLRQCLTPMQFDSVQYIVSCRVHNTQTIAWQRMIDIPIKNTQLVRMIEHYIQAKAVRVRGAGEKNAFKDVPADILEHEKKSTPYDKRTG